MHPQTPQASPHVIHDSVYATALGCMLRAYHVALECVRLRGSAFGHGLPAAHEEGPMEGVVTDPCKYALNLAYPCTCRRP